ncbi:MAG: alpha/beta fold hydrolase [Rubrivivax sp.]|nr:alpha/beta fold hydrolase [Rubrivivax sp.]
MPAAPSPPVTHELRFAHVASGARIAWARSGRAGAHTLVRVAHWMTHVEFDLRSPLWQPWLERLGRPFTLVRYDERGCGCSGRDDHVPDLETAVEELDAVVQAHGARPVALLGISGAAPPAIAYAARFPERVSHLVLLGGFTHGLRHRNVPAETLAYHDAQVRLVETGWGRNDPAVQEFFTSRFLPDGTPEARAALTEQQRLSCDGQRAAALMRARVLLDVRPFAPLVRAPTLVLHCAGDMAVPVAMGHEMAAAIPGARFESLPSRNHLPLPQEPAFERLCEAITAFVAPSPAVPALTARERELAALVGQGRDNAQLAAHLGVAEKTVRNMLSTLYGKLGVEGRPQAVVRARDLGL